MKINLDDLTLGELETFESEGGSFEALSTGKLTASAIVALVYVVGKRDNPEFTRDDARGIRFQDVELVAPDPQ